MKTTRTLLFVGGAANAVFFLFHVFLGWQIHRLASVDMGVRWLLELLNGGGAVFCLFLALGSWLAANEAHPTKLARLVALTAAVVYLVRGGIEFFGPRAANPAIVVTCLATGLVYVAALIGQRRLMRAEPGPGFGPPVGHLGASKAG